MPDWATEVAFLTPWFDHTAADVPSFRRRRTRIADEEVRLDMSEGDAHELWQLPVHLECAATVLEADP
ncbi:MAG TPA: hypothetical protein VF086_19600 [Propionibacteriaceae bacterium]